MDRLIAMESFVRTVERGSFAAAAGRGLSPSMVGNHVRFLEGRLGALLLNRTTRQHSVTEFGRDYYEKCRRILLEVEDAERAADLAQVMPRGLLRVTAPMSLGTTIVPNIIAAYLRRHAEVQVELVLQDLRLDLLADEFDVAIRVGALPDSGLIARALPPLSLIPCASPAYLRAHGHPSTPADLQSHNCLDFTHAGEPRLWRFNGPRGEVAVQVSGTLRANNGQALQRRGAAASGHHPAARDRDCRRHRLGAADPRLGGPRRPVAAASPADPAGSASIAQAAQLRRARHRNVQVNRFNAATQLASRTLTRSRRLVLCAKFKNFGPRNKAISHKGKIDAGSPVGPSAE
ncbi:LysR family transcriptional regulator [Rhodopila sp.]|uniref:LysR family transcriptional regulator n=1 Tax=Rhodopila sp. TaxID=2480087 RepID=UPI003D10D900